MYDLVLGAGIDALRRPRPGLWRVFVPRRVKGGSDLTLGMAGLMSRKRSRMGYREDG